MIRRKWRKKAENDGKKLKKIKKLVETNLTNRKTGCKLYDNVTPLSPQEKMFFNENDGGSHRKKRKKHKTVYAENFCSSDCALSAFPEKTAVVSDQITKHKV